jgi:hypothetical protein
MIFRALTLRYLIRFGLVAAGFALIAYGILDWHDRRFSMAGFWPLDGPPQLHPLHVLILGVAMIPAAVWEIFLLDSRSRRAGRDAEPAGRGHDEP